jgi:hypothetical protein
MKALAIRAIKNGSFQVEMVASAKENDSEICH